MDAADVMAASLESGWQLGPLAAAHTPGPWQLCHHLKSLEADAACPCGYRGGIFGGDGKGMVCEMGSTIVPGEEGLEAPRYPRPVELANARLIAAAPDLLAACKEAAALLENIVIDGPRLGADTTLARLRAAVAKGEGE